VLHGWHFFVVVPIYEGIWRVPTKRGQLPDNLVPLSQLQAMPMRTESFTDDAAKIVGRIKTLLVQLPRGFQFWVVGISVSAASVAGVVTGLLVLDRLGLPFRAATLTGDPLLCDELANTRRGLVDTEQAAKAAMDANKTLSQSLAAIETDRDEACNELADRGLQSGAVRPN
jgi:hypothetical protein